LERCGWHESGAEERVDPAQQKLKPCEDEAEVVSDCGKDGVGVIAGIAFEEVAAEVSVGLHVADHWFDG